MATKHEIHVTVSEDGIVELEGKGFKGPACAKEIDAILAAVGRKTGERRTPEYVATETVRVGGKR